MTMVLFTAFCGLCNHVCCIDVRRGSFNIRIALEFVEILFIILMRNSLLMWFDWTLGKNLPCPYLPSSILFSGIFINEEKYSESMDFISIARTWNCNHHSCTCSEHLKKKQAKKCCLPTFFQHKMQSWQKSASNKVYHLVLNSVTFRFSHWHFFSLLFTLEQIYVLVAFANKQTFEPRTCRMNLMKI